MSEMAKRLLDEAAKKDTPRGALEALLQALNAPESLQSTATVAKAMERAEALLRVTAQGEDFREYARTSLAVSAAVAQRRETCRQVREQLPEILLMEGRIGGLAGVELTKEQADAVANLAAGVVMKTTVYVNPPQVAPHLLEVLERPR